MKYIKPVNNELDIFDNGFDELFKPFMPMPKPMGIKTDVKEKDGNYILEMEVPGTKKEDISVDFEDGYITIVAKREYDKEDNKNEKYLRKERYCGTCTRKFYIGDINEKDIKANYTDGVLYLTFPKDSKKVENKKQISID